jgi:hypothetical protein
MRLPLLWLQWVEEGFRIYNLIGMLMPNASKIQWETNQDRQLVEDDDTEACH